MLLVDRCRHRRLRKTHSDLDEAPKPLGSGFPFITHQNPTRSPRCMTPTPRSSLAKTEYSAILADVDYLHGIAESFLTITNLLIVDAFRKAVRKAEKQDTPGAGGMAVPRGGPNIPLG